ncbi:hypothetical protein ACFV9C_26115 [Kribbella sp. NPDC059898]|uniref:hypothetical protein n=1 Tax=Kribbella sp. NPDC059898 TaxID=3346995 RepID=UPI00366258A5
MRTHELPQLTLQERPAKNLAARLEGTLTVVSNYIGVQTGDHFVEVAWPPGCTVVAYGASFAVLDADGWVVGKVGAVVVLGGGSIGPESAHAVSPTGRARIFAVAGAQGLHH